MVATVYLILLQHDITSLAAPIWQHCCTCSNLVNFIFFLYYLYLLYSLSFLCYCTYCNCCIYCTVLNLFYLLYSLYLLYLLYLLFLLYLLCLILFTDLEDVLHPHEISDYNNYGKGHVHWTLFCLRFPKIYNTWGVKSKIFARDLTILGWCHLYS